MRVLLPAHQALAVGGIGTIARGLAKSVPAALGDEGELVVPSLSPIAEKGVSGLRGAGTAARLYHEQVSLAWRSRRFDLVHLCDLRPIAASPTRFLITVHDVNFLDRPEWSTRPARSYKTAMLRLSLAKKPAFVVCDSSYTRDRLMLHMPGAPPDRLRVVYPGVDASGTDWSGGGPDPYFLTVGTIEPRKNHLGLLEAFRRARERAGVRWVVAGTPGQLSAPIVAALEAEPGVELVGRVDSERLEALYRDALFVATPSHIEGFGYPPLEAMVRGVPTLTSNATSLPEVVGDAGPMVAPDDASGWADQIERLAGDEAARRELSERGRARAAEFTWEAAARQVVALYREAL
jgi:glycosyltransferase involved in cell wall biosynthesis